MRSKMWASMAPSRWSLRAFEARRTNTGTLPTSRSSSTTLRAGHISRGWRRNLTSTLADLQRTAAYFVVMTQHVSYARWASGGRQHAAYLLVTPRRHYSGLATPETVRCHL